ncbi:hypothetical protein GGS26DRAFT_304160 [Hypomontagnella submonticulosa]|nr:hypothetical protein GGS26DRAFT_304160 [Hypomontagnella submonticulosa]
MVVGTVSRNSLKNLLPKIHQPLPLSRRESQQLLDSITTSFRKNLDKEHPWELNDESKLRKPAHQNSRPLLSTPTPASSSSPTLDTPSHQRPTDRHLRAILSNPLFAHSENKKPKDPFDVFDSAVSRGLMTPSRATGFLIKLRSQIQAESANDIRQAMAVSGAGLRVVQWLRASGLENHPHFPFSRTLISNLIPFMCAEGLDEIAWTWVERVSSRHTKDEEASHLQFKFKALYRLLQAIIKNADTTHPGQKAPLDGQYKAIIRANEILPKDSKIALAGFKAAWVGVSWSSTVFASEHLKPSAPLFETFVNIGRPLDKPLDMAHLELHHPLTPNHSAAVEFMHHNINYSTEPDPATRRRLICLALDAVSRLKEVGDVDEVSWVERFVARIYNGLGRGIFNGAEEYLIASEIPIYRMN